MFFFFFFFCLFLVFVCLFVCKFYKGAQLLCLFTSSGHFVVVVVVLLFYVHGKHLWSCRYGELTLPHFSWTDLDLLSG